MQALWQSVVRLRVDPGNEERCHRRDVEVVAGVTAPFQPAQIRVRDAIDDIRDAADVACWKMVGFDVTPDTAKSRR